MEQLQFTLPYPPSVNQLYKTNPRTGRVYLSKAGKDYKKAVKMAIKWKDKPIDKPIKLKMYKYVPDRRKRDSDNLNKILWDSLTFSGLIKDDSLIYDDRSIMSIDRKFPRVEIILKY